MEIKDIVIVGNGGFAREVEWLIERINYKKPQWNFRGFIDESEGIYVVGNDSFVLNVKEELYVAIAIGNTQIRRKLFEKYKSNRHLKFPNLIDPSVLMSSRIGMGMGNIICAGSVLTVDIEMGDFNILNLKCTVGHDVKINSFITVNPGTNISGNVSIGSLTEIGTGSRIIQGISIHEKTILGAGSVVIKNICEEGTYVGGPVRRVK